MTDETKLLRTTIKMVVLSDRDVSDWDLAQIVEETNTGDFSGHFEIEKVEELTSEQMRAALEAQGSDPDFIECTGASL